ncbi:uncharacterized protein N7482_002685 [Penicillium canariense]|uniref:Membrane insertase YidC/Oxa/ALB C-terminal domain-containing protein n=1 Tax=Penicillium canariense TaxID=189055 RepID=A0A9W9LU50_9EURO|nr:uncharacterized protein N7482_002685 [Penicillium canariense]KAJ5176808.1 hypothetical protein N7482_002685 [Penicillium canariense]
MMGAAGLKGPGAAAMFARQRLTAVPRSTRSISTFRPQRFQSPGQKSHLTLTSSGSARWHFASVAAGPAAIRFNSTSSNPTPSPVSETSTPIDPSYIGYDISEIPEKIGYLKELGLDYGWGPSSMLQYVIEHLHMWTGMPWWASIVGAAILVRVGLFKPTMGASDTGARTHNARPVIDPIRQEMMKARLNGQTHEFQIKKAQLDKIQAEHGIKSIKALIPMLQIPLGYGIFRVVRGMTSLPVPALLSESALWLNDLTVADPFYAIPVITAGCLYMTLKKGGETGTMDILNTSAGKAMLIGLPAISFTFMAFQPGALQLYFLSTGLLGLAQAHIINNPKFRNMMGMAIPKRHEQSQADMTNLEQLQARLAELQANPEKVKQPEPTDNNISGIDRVQKNISSWGEKAKQEVSDKWSEVRGNTTKNADGSRAAKPRLSEEDRRAAERYEQEAKSREAYEREERNHARRSAHMRALAAERQKAQDSLKRYQQAARSSQSGRK